MNKLNKRVTAIVTAMLVSAVGLFVAWAAEPPGSPVPRAINYDGTLEQSDQVASGIHDFQFRLVDESGTQIWPSSDYADRTVDVKEGKFSVKFPEDSEEALGDEVFETRPLYLRIWVKTDADSVYYQLTPDVQIDAVPFAVRSERAVQVDVLPPGSLMPFYGIDEPYGWLISDGRTIDYREDGDCTGDVCGAYLQKLVEHLRGINTVQSTTNPSEVEQAHLPDLRGVFLRGQDLGAGMNPDSGDDEIGVMQADATARPNNNFTMNNYHRHTLPTFEKATYSPSGYSGWPYSPGTGPGFNSNSSTGYTEYSGSSSAVSSSGGGDAETRPANVTVLHIVKW